jgi:hypothetical protein
MRDGWITEQMLAEMLGISVPRVKELRPDLERGEDWDLDDGRIVYSQSGVEQVTILLGIAPRVDAEKRPPEAPADTRMPHEPGTMDEAAGGQAPLPAASQGPAAAENPPLPQGLPAAAAGMQVWVAGPAGNKKWLVCGPFVDGKRIRRKMFVRMMGSIRPVPKGKILEVKVGKNGVLEYWRGGTR